MKNRWIALGMVSMAVLQISAAPGAALPVFAEEIDGEEAEILNEEGADVSEQSAPETAAEGKLEEEPAIQIEGIEVIESADIDSNTEKKITEYLKEREEQQEAQREEARKRLPEGFYVDPNYYPAANVDENTRIIYRYLTQELELNHAAACGVLANIHLESFFRPLAFGDGGTSYGICQWHLGRFSSLVGYCIGSGLDYNTVEGQLAFLKRELETGYAGVLEYIKNVPDTAQGAYDAAYYWCVYFEMPDQSLLRGQQRGNLAEKEYFPRGADLLAEGETVSGEENKITIVKIDLDEVVSQVLYDPEVAEVFLQWKSGE